MPERERKRERESQKRVEPSDFSTLLSPFAISLIISLKFQINIFIFSKKAGFVSPKDCTNKYIINFYFLFFINPHNMADFTL